MEVAHYVQCRRKPWLWDWSHYSADIRLDRFLIGISHSHLVLCAKRLTRLGVDSERVNTLAQSRQHLGAKYQYRSNGDTTNGVLIHAISHIAQQF